MNRYTQILERIFFGHYRRGLKGFEFAREEIETQAADLKIKLPKNLGDLIYSFRYRTDLPDGIRALAPAKMEWIIRPAGKGRYRFVLTRKVDLAPNPNLARTKVPDATPGIISKYALSDEQALLAKLRYNRLIDIFTGISVNSLQNHLRTSVVGMGQVETDELYVGLDRQGAHYVVPVQAKGGRDRMSAVQIEQDIALCAEKFPGLICRAIGAQFTEDNVIALFEFEAAADGIRIRQERHYQLVPPDAITPEDLARYRQMAGQE